MQRAVTSARPTCYLSHCQSLRWEPAYLLQWGTALDPKMVEGRPLQALITFAQLAPCTQASILMRPILSLVSEFMIWGQKVTQSTDLFTQEGREYGM